MPLHRTVLIGVAILGVVFCSVFLWIRSSERDDRRASTSPAPTQRPFAPTANRPPAANADEIAALRGEVASLRAELFALRRERVLKRTSSMSGDAAPRSDALARSPSREEAAQEYQARMLAIELAFRRQPVDPAWSARTSSAI